MKIYKGDKNGWVLRMGTWFMFTQHSWSTISNKHFIVILPIKARWSLLMF